MVAIERDNPRLKGVLPKDYARPALDKHRLGELIDLIGTIALVSPRSGGRESAEDPAKDRLTSASTSRSVDLLGRVYEYFLTQFASAEGKNGGQFYTPSCVVRLLVEMLAPYTALRGSATDHREASSQVVSAAKDNGRIYDPACGSGGSLPASRLCGVRFAKKNRAIAPGVVQSQGQDKWARRQHPFGLAKRARRVRGRSRNKATPPRAASPS